MLGKIILRFVRYGIVHLSKTQESYSIGVRSIIKVKVFIVIRHERPRLAGATYEHSRSGSSEHVCPMIAITGILLLEDCFRVYAFIAHWPEVGNSTL